MSALIFLDANFDNSKRIHTKKGVKTHRRCLKPNYQLTFVFLKPIHARIQYYSTFEAKEDTIEGEVIYINMYIVCTIWHCCLDLSGYLV